MWQNFNDCSDCREVIMAAAVTAPESLGAEETMEEGELSDDGMEEPETPIRVRQPIQMDIPDLLKELTGAEEFKKVDPETVNRMAKRAERFNMSGKSVSYEEISKLYRSMQVNNCFLKYFVIIFH